jgi:hypothetical protein
MRYLLTCFLFAALIAGGCNDPKGPGTGSVTGPSAIMDSTTIQWLDSTKDFGKIEEGQKLEVAFRYRNTGDKPLVIDRVQPSCGCTVADQSKTPVAPGEVGIIKAVFNSEGHPGTNHKTLFVYSNTRGARNSALQFVVEVEKKK